ncbi:hypothetical protein HP456_19430 [Bacillus haikouensis]|nr:hypothetical protein [Bacillus haikouensis]
MYSVALTSYLATGGDGFTAFKNGTKQVEGPPLLDSFSPISFNQAEVLPRRK